MEKFDTLEEMQHRLETYGYIPNIMSEPLWTAFRKKQLCIYDVMGKWLKMKRATDTFTAWLQEIHQNGTDEERNDLISFLEYKTKGL